VVYRIQSIQAWIVWRIWQVNLNCSKAKSSPHQLLEEGREALRVTDTLATAKVKIAGAPLRSKYYPTVAVKVDGMKPDLHKDYRY